MGQQQGCVADVRCREADRRHRSGGGVVADRVAGRVGRGVRRPGHRRCRSDDRLRKVFDRARIGAADRHGIAVGVDRVRHDRLGDVGRFVQYGIVHDASYGSVVATAPVDPAVGEDADLDICGARRKPVANVRGGIGADRKRRADIDAARKSHQRDRRGQHRCGRNRRHIVGQPDPTAGSWWKVVTWTTTLPTAVTITPVGTDNVGVTADVPGLVAIHHRPPEAPTGIHRRFE